MRMMILNKTYKYLLIVVCGALLFAGTACSDDEPKMDDGSNTEAGTNDSTSDGEDSNQDNDEGSSALPEYQLLIVLRL